MKTSTSKHPKAFGKSMKSLLKNDVGDVALLNAYFRIVQGVFTLLLLIQIVYICEAITNQKCDKKWYLNVSLLLRALTVLACFICLGIVWSKSALLQFFNFINYIFHNFHECTD